MKIELNEKKQDEVQVYPDSYIDEIISKSKVDYHKEYPEGKYLLHFVDENSELIEVCSVGNISGTVGGAKAKKTFFLTMLESCFFNQENNFAIQGDLNGRKLLHIDTEQTFTDTQRIMKRIKRLNNEIPKHVDFIALREVDDIDLRLEVIHKLVKSGDYSFITIDGIVDICNDFNDQPESRSLIRKLMAWSSKYECHIHNVLHLNKDMANARGHLGTELINKSQTVIKVTKEDDNYSLIQHDRARNKPFKEWRFMINDKGLPERTEFPTGYYDNSYDNNNSPF